MRNIFVILLGLYNLNLYAQTNIKDLNWKTFKFDECNFSKELWLKSLLDSSEFTEKIIFSKECDLAGNLKVKANSLFPIGITIRNSNVLIPITGKMKYYLQLEQSPILRIEFSELKSKSKYKLPQNINISLSYSYLDKKVKLLSIKADGKELSKLLSK